MASFPISAKKMETERTDGPNWLELPRDLTTNVLQRLGVVEIVTSACLVCPLWWNICKEPSMWRNIDLANDNTSRYDLKKICMYAIDRSCGQVEAINIEWFGTEDLLEYIADRTSRLRRLRLAHCWEVYFVYQFSPVVKKLPLLEELDFTDETLSTRSIEIIGQSCPLLKSLKFGTEVYWDHEGDNEAFAIAKTMSGLRHLKLIRNMISNVGLLVILDGCPHLETLHLEHCFFVDLTGSLGKRCSEQIKDFIFLNDYAMNQYCEIYKCS